MRCWNHVKVPDVTLSIRIVHPNVTVSTGFFQEHMKVCFNKQAEIIDKIFQ